MKDKFIIPNTSNEITICRKEDIIECIDDNIIDKEVALALVEDLEVNIAKCIKEGRWCTIPYTCTLRIPKEKLLLMSDEQQQIIEKAKEELTVSQYVRFRQKLGTENIIRVRNERYYKYVVSMNINKYKTIYKRLIRRVPVSCAMFIMFSMDYLVGADNELVNYGEE